LHPGFEILGQRVFDFRLEIRGAPERKFWPIHHRTRLGLCSRRFSSAEDFYGASKIRNGDGLENLQIFAEKKRR
jgi:hypothetical protein